ncbi:hypothetical protein DUNSADRAFT_15920 [Dunaliella salina]|uniref:PH domain-containing protein n=1 Tax=Dunaliella salina TaxID=3046 RepID=A0ABQ7H1D8_DUNSA|nr:hypothetical protein DUNSADRAFT_15920 [Dunaliella salina]|eukprot:KAF5840678.1 hypothetical protein DUNSADRAFT_15920 [Dunaliella salina]
MHSEPFPLAQPAAAGAESPELEDPQQAKSAPNDGTQAPGGSPAGSPPKSSPISIPATQQGVTSGATQQHQLLPQPQQQQQQPQQPQQQPQQQQQQRMVYHRPGASDGATAIAPASKRPMSPSMQDNTLHASMAGHAATQPQLHLNEKKDGHPPSLTPQPSFAGLSSSYDRVMSHPAKLLSKLKIGSKRSTPKAPLPLHPHNNHNSPQLPSSGGAFPKEGGSGGPDVALHHQEPASTASADAVSAFEAHPTAAVAAAEAASSSSRHGSMTSGLARKRSLLSGAPTGQGNLCVEVPPTPNSLQGYSSAQPGHSSSTYHPSPSVGGGPMSAGSASLPSTGPASCRQTRWSLHSPQRNHGFGGHGAGEGDVEEFSPGASQPHNPLAPLLTPFRLMAPVAHKAIAAAKADMKKNWKYTTAHTRGIHAGTGTHSCRPKARSSLLFSQTQDSHVWSISLRDAVLEADESNPRQLKISAPQGEIFLRTIRSADREKWLQCLQNSIEVYKQNQMVVEVLKNKGLLNQGQDADPTAPGSGTPALPLPEVADMDVEQRRRIRYLTAEQLAQVAPFQAEMERQMVELSAKLQGAATGFAEKSEPNVTASKTFSSPPDLLLTGATPRSSLGDDPQERHAQQHQEQPKQQQQQEQQQEASSTKNRKHDAGHLGRQDGAEAHTHRDAAAMAQAAAHDLGLAPVAAAAAGVSTASNPDCCAHAGTGIAGNPGHCAEFSSAQAELLAQGKPPQSQSIQQAYSKLIEAMRCGFHAEAVRTVQLEMENFALNRTVAYLKQQASTRNRALDRIRGSNNSRHDLKADGTPSTPVAKQSWPGSLGAQGINLVREGSGRMMRRASSGRMDDAASVMTADEDAFDVTEAFDEGVDYGILDDDDMDAPDHEDVLVSLPHRRSPHHPSTSRRPSLSAQASPRVASSPGLKRRTHVTGDTCDEEDDEETYAEGHSHEEDGEEEDEEEAEQAKVLNALEVVRQVEYVEKAQNAEGLTDVITTQAPPSKDRMSGVARTSTHENIGDVDGNSEQEDDEEDSDSGEEENRHEPKGVRTRLPMPRPLGKGFSLWSLLKNMIGKDLTRITMPATINEPTSSLQRLCESLEYANLLDRLPSEPNSLDRLMLVSVWNLTCYNSLAQRDGKPFNPLLGETYEWQSPDSTKR